MDLFKRVLFTYQEEADDTGGLGGGLGAGHANDNQAEENHGGQSDFGGTEGSGDSPTFEDLEAKLDAIDALAEVKSYDYENDIAYGDDWAVEFNDDGTVASAYGITATKDGIHLSEYKDTWYGSVNDYTFADKTGQITTHDTTVNSFGFSFSYDIHHNTRNHEVGMFTEIIADLVETLGFDLELSTIDTIDTIETAVSILYGLINVKAFIQVASLAKSYGMTKLAGISAILGGISAYGVINNLEKLGFTNNTKDTYNHNVLNQNYIANAGQNTIAGQEKTDGKVVVEDETVTYTISATQMNYIEMMLLDDDDIDIPYESMAGGDIYNAMAGSFGYNPSVDVDLNEMMHKYSNKLEPTIQI